MDTLLDRLEQWVGLDRADLLGLALALLGCAVATVVALRVPLQAALDSDPVAATATAAASPSGAPVDGPVVVHIAGAVARPGVVQLEAGDRVADALAAAGGPSPDAALGGLNLARALVDGEQVRVPTIEQAAAATSDPTTSIGGDAAGAATLPDGRLDLNTADAAELEELPGVGPVLAQRILAHRDEHGPFTEAAMLREVSGIGEATWGNLRDLVGVR